MGALGSAYEAIFLVESYLRTSADVDADALPDVCTVAMEMIRCGPGHPVLADDGSTTVYQVCLPLAPVLPYLLSAR